jgi:2-oxoglutarate dehydrogenase E2 component (dihydrolipoamide succinyltransferase)
MAEFTIQLPNLGDEAGAEATVTYWHKAEGETVEADDDIVEVTYDKATFYVPCPVRGVVKKILAPEDATVPVGSPLAIIETAEDK